MLITTLALLKNSQFQIFIQVDWQISAKAFENYQRIEDEFGIIKATHPHNCMSCWRICSDPSINVICMQTIKYSYKLRDTEEQSVLNSVFIMLLFECHSGKRYKQQIWIENMLGILRQQASQATRRQLFIYKRGATRAYTFSPHISLL